MNCEMAHFITDRLLLSRYSQTKILQLRQCGQKVKLSHKLTNQHALDDGVVEAFKRANIEYTQMYVEKYVIVGVI